MKALRAALIVSFALALSTCIAVEEQETRTVSQGLEIHVPADYLSIQAAINAASAGSAVMVAAGDYTENVSLKSGVSLVGAGRDLTTLRGQIRIYASEEVHVSGFRVTAEGASGYSPNIGIAGAGCSGEVLDNTVEGFGSGIGLETCSETTVTGNLVRLNQAGIETMETDTTLIANNVIHHNTNAGIVLFADSSPDIVNNTIVGNGYGQAFDQGGAGVVVATEFFGNLANNIIVSNHGGINVLYSCGGGQHNLVWGNATNYVGNAQAGSGDISQDPLFVNPAAKDYRVHGWSPAVDTGIEWTLTTDFDGNARPSGVTFDLGAFEIQIVALQRELVITEVMANPLNEATGEYIELYNPGTQPIDIDGLAISDGDSTDAIVVYPSASTTLVPAGGYALVLDRDHIAGSTYDIPGSAVLLSVPNAAIGSGLSTADPITLTRFGFQISTYSHPFNPGDGLSVERIDPDGPDTAENWVTSPCGASPGRANCISSGGGPAGLPTLVISEVMANPADQTLGEFVEIFNFGEDPIELTGLVLSDGDSTDPIIAVAGRSSSLPGGALGILIDPDYVATLTGPPYYLTTDIAVVVTVTSSALGNGLASNDPVAILDDDGQTPIATFSHPVITSSQSIERIDPLEADLASNWIPSPCAEKHSAGRPNCASASGGTGETPALLLNEVMANALDEDLGEFVEIYNPLDTPVDVAGMILSDGDATDVIGPFPGAGGNTIIPAQGFGLILDPEYAAGIYAIPTSTVLLAPDDTTLGNGLATDDPITLLASDGRTAVSRFSFPFNPGNGISVERKGNTGDVQSNWVASPCTSGSSPGAPNCSAESAPEPIPEVRLVISEVMANPLDEARGEFVEIVNRGDAALTLEGYVLSDGDATDTIHGFEGGETVLLPGAIGVILDRSYSELVEPPYDIIGVGTAGCTCPAAPPSEPYVRFSRIRLS
ncbi:MAG: lamin tail domain-containing protein, partial [Bradymonadales bacterium]|nr:lamin tail domain-containing protein [Bradymonadales bacterium]